MILASIIIPTYNRCDILSKLLISITKQEKINNFEVIVIDNGSTDETKLVCYNYKTSIQNFIYSYDDEPGLLTGRHRGANLASGEILCFLDDDVELNPNFIENLISLFTQNKDVQLATGPCKPKYEIEPPKWLKYFWDQTTYGKYCAWLSLIDLGDELIEIDPNFVWGLNFSIRKKTLIELDGFHPDCIPDKLQQYQGDGETGLTIKAKKNGYKAYYYPGLALDHHISANRLTLTYFKKRAFYQGVCNSYSDLRNYNKPSATKTTFLRKIRNKLHPYYRWIKLINQKPKRTILPKDIQEMIEIIEESSKNGYNFHQNHFKNDNKIREWVLKSNYWDYKLPK